ncbi:MAG: ATP-binding cassette domain-containing protein [Proteobacteria bacterium]|nr:ATP-binding cassette domain-containing protein [Pseudomonadota bacterium]
MAQVFAISLALQVFGLASPYFMQLVVDRAIPLHDTDLLVVASVGFGLLAIVSALTGALRSWVILYLGSTMGIQLGGNLFRHLLRLPLPFFESRHLGDITSRFGSLGTVQNLITTGIVQAFMDGLLAILTLALMFFYNAGLTFLTLGVLAVQIAGQAAVFGPMKRRVEEQIVRQAEQDTVFLESARAEQALKLLGVDGWRGSLWLNRAADPLTAGIRHARLGLAYGTANGTLGSLTGIAVVYLGARSIMDGQWTLGALLAFVAYRGNFVGQVQTLVALTVQYRMARLHLDRVADIALTETEDAGETRAEPPLSLQGRVLVREVSFRYSELEPWVIENLSLEIGPGEFVAIAGRSGCGKTTLLKLVLGLLRPERGQVWIDDVAAHRVGRGQLGGGLAAVMQQDQLLSGSLIDNVCCFDPSPDLDYAQECIAGVGLDEAVAAMAMGVQTRIGDLGFSLSGGERQRLLLARALDSRPRVLVLDEATSHLDPESEATVNATLRKLEITRILAAHRQESLALADRVVRIDTTLGRRWKPAGAATASRRDWLRFLAGRWARLSTCLRTEAPPSSNALPTRSSQTTGASRWRWSAERGYTSGTRTATAIWTSPGASRPPCSATATRGWWPRWRPRPTRSGTSPTSITPPRRSSWRSGCARTPSPSACSSAIRGARPTRPRSSWRAATSATPAGTASRSWSSTAASTGAACSR